MRRIARWQVPLCMIASSVAAALAGGRGQEVLRWDRDAIAAGELWRLVTGHLAHLGAAHLALNLAGLALVWILVGDRLKPLGWWLVVAFGIAVIDLGFWFLDPGLAWYVGLSGLLHTLILAGTTAGARTAPLESLALGGLVLAKIVVEQLAGPLPGSEATSGGPVVVNAHLYGAIAGLAAGGFVLAMRAEWRRAPI
ncbi:MAG TPA: rhombosortase [Woeseiaceae bacterium]